MDELLKKLTQLQNTINCGVQNDLIRLAGEQCQAIIDDFKKLMTNVG